MRTHLDTLTITFFKIYLEREKKVDFTYSGKKEHLPKKETANKSNSSLFLTRHMLSVEQIV